MTVLSKHTYRIAADFKQSQKYWTNYETSDIFEFPSGVSMQIQVGIRETTKPSEVFYDVPDGTVLKLEIKRLRSNGDAPNADDPAYMSQEFTVSGLSTLTLSDWQSGANQHATFDYAAADTALPVGEYWMVISGVLPDASVISANYAKIRVVQDGTGPETTVAPELPAEYSASEVDALLAGKQSLVALGVADPTVTGVAADLHTEGYTNETPPRYFIKIGVADTDWLQVLLNSDIVNFENIIPPTGTTSEIDSLFLSSIAVPDAIYFDREKRIQWQALTNSTRQMISGPALTTSTYYISDEDGDDSNGTANDPRLPFKTIKAAFTQFETDNPSFFEIVFVIRAGVYDEVDILENVTTQQSSKNVYVLFEKGSYLACTTLDGVMFDNSGSKCSFAGIYGWPVVPSINRGIVYKGDALGSTISEYSSFEFHSAMINGPSSVIEITGGRAFVKVGQVYFNNSVTATAVDFVKASGGSKIQLDVGSVDSQTTGPGRLVSLNESSHGVVKSASVRRAEILHMVDSDSIGVIQDSIHSHSASFPIISSYLASSDVATSNVYIVGTCCSSLGTDSNVTEDTTFGSLIVNSSASNLLTSF